MAISTIPLASAVSGVLPDGSAPSGSVIQVVQAISTSTQSITTTNYTDSLLTASITPTSASSKILIIVSQQVNTYRNAAVKILDYLNICRNNSEIVSFRVVGVNAGTASNGYIEIEAMMNVQYLDSPNTTSSVTYKTQGRLNSNANSGTMTVQEGGEKSVITLLEIAA